MIYITYTKPNMFDDVTINNVWSIDCDNIEEDYKKFVINYSDEIGIYINHHWLNVMVHERINEHLTLEEYKLKSTKFNKFIRKWSIDKYIELKTNGKKENFKNLII